MVAKRMLSKGQLIKTVMAVTIAAVILISYQTGFADELPPDPITMVAFDQNLNAMVPQHLTFYDENGQEVFFSSFIGERPVILVFAYYECPMLCSLVLNELTYSLKEIEFNPGEHFEVVVISIDPRETPDLAAEKKKTYLEEYDRPGTEGGWHFLVSDEEPVETLTSVVGFQYYYDEKTDEFAHPAGLTLLTPDGRISRYFFGITFDPLDLRLGILEASENRIGSLVDQVYLYCFEYDPSTGTYGLLINNVLRLAGGATVVGLGSVVGFFLLVERVTQKSKKRKGEGG
jgi:protein SCO1